MKGCPIAGGDLIVDDYGKPLVWIGCYVALASFISSAAMVTGASPNAATLAVLTVAVKIPVDLNTAMPRSTDQLAKLSGTVFLCIAMGNFLHSLGDSSTVFANVIALAILVITVVVNIIMQISTGVIYIFVVEHLAVTAILILLLIVSISSALAIVVAKEQLEKELDRKIRDPEFSPAQSISLDQLGSFGKKFLLMVRFASPQNVLSMSMISTTSVFFFCLAAFVILLTAYIRVRSFGRSLKQCKGTSDYAWSTFCVIGLQGTGAMFGLLILFMRWFLEALINRMSWKDVKVDDHWLQLLISWKGIPLEEDIMNFNKIFFQIKIAAINFGIYLQKAVVLSMKVGHLLSHFLVWFMDGIEYEDQHLDNYVLRLREENFDRRFIEDVSNEFERWIKAGRHNKALATKNLIERYSTHEQGFTQVCTFLPPLDNCWALPLVTLTTIAATISTSEEGTQSLLRAVGEGLRYVRLVDKHLDDRGMVNSRMAADMVWTDLRIYNKWLGAKLTNDRQTELTLEDLFRIADNMARSSTWDLGLSEMTLAAVCMRDITRILLYETGDGELFERLRVAIADIMGACLTNLLKALFIGFICCRKEEREKNVSLAASILGEAEEILTLVHIPDVDKQRIDEWRVPQSS